MPVIGFCYHHQVRIAYFTSFAIDGDNIIVTGLHADAHMEITREAAYKIFLHPDPHQEALLTEMINGRHEMASLCGFPSYAHRLVNIVQCIDGLC